MRKLFATFVFAIALSGPVFAEPQAQNAMIAPRQAFFDSEIRAFWTNFWYVFAFHAYMFAAW